MKLICIISVVCHIYKSNLTKVLTHYIVFAIIPTMTNFEDAIDSRSVDTTANYLGFDPANYNHEPLLRKLPRESAIYARRRLAAIAVGAISLFGGIKAAEAMIEGAEIANAAISQVVDFSQERFVEHWDSIGRRPYDNKPQIHVVVKPGDTLTSIALDMCGTENNWSEYMSAVATLNNLPLNKVQTGATLQAPVVCY